MEPPTNPNLPKSAAPIVDVIAPVKTAEPVAAPETASDGVVAAPAESAEEKAGQAATNSKNPVSATAVKSKQPKPAKVSSTPTLAITVAVLLFIILSGLAYYAYTKNT